MQTPSTYSILVENIQGNGLENIHAECIGPVEALLCAVWRQYKWLNRRSQKRSYTWDAFNPLLAPCEVPLPRVTEGPSNRPERPCQTGSMGWKMLYVDSADTSYWKFSCR